MREDTDVLYSHDRSICLFEIEAKLLGITVGNETGFVLRDFPLCISFDGEDPIDTDGFPDWWKLGKLPGFILLDAFDFVFHRRDPMFSFGTVDGFFVRRILVRGLSISLRSLST